MRYLEELEKKVLHLIEKHQALQMQFNALLKENETLREQAQLHEASLLKEATSAHSLEQEKAAIVHSIEELLSNINALESNLRS